MIIFDLLTVMLKKKLSQDWTLRRFSGLGFSGAKKGMDVNDSDELRESEEGRKTVNRYHAA